MLCSPALLLRAASHIVPASQAFSLPGHGGGGSFYRLPDGVELRLSLGLGSVTHRSHPSPDLWLVHSVLA